uniref:Uncharacterized protein n=1 Tax=Siphoviridae sp. cthrG7 TaxID=2826428 RepID=A0A8S5MCB8_9CAUD|nr:MAG TPA: hypothetical protein [Siphoviridae sp. cthrG7]
MWCRSLLVNDRLCPRVSRGHFLYLPLSFLILLAI